MTRRLVLEDFADPPPPPAFPDIEPDPAPVEAAALSQDGRLAAFDEGYKSGWDDCAAEEAGTSRKVGADLASNLQQLACTYEEARQDVFQSLASLFQELAETLLPKLAAEAVAPVVMEELAAAAKAASTGDIELIASPTALPVLEHLIETSPDLTAKLSAEPAYAEGQVSIRFGAERRDVDLTDASQQMAEAIRNFVDQQINPVPG